jgi:hypothetical protein
MNSVITSLLVAHAASEATETSFLKPVQLHQRGLSQASTLKETAKGEHGKPCKKNGTCDVGYCKENICCLNSEKVEKGKCVTDDELEAHQLNQMLIKRQEIEAKIAAKAKTASETASETKRRTLPTAPQHPRCGSFTSAPSDETMCEDGSGNTCEYGKNRGKTLMVGSTFGKDGECPAPGGIDPSRLMPGASASAGIGFQTLNPKGGFKVY